MRTTTHVSVASLTTQPPLAQGSENKWSRKPLAALLTGFLLGVLAPMAAFAQHTAGSLYFVNRTDGSEAFGYLDRDGYFQQTQGYYYTPRPKIGTTHAVNTSNGIFLYNANWQRMVVQIRDDGYADDFSTGFDNGGPWTDIVSVGNYLFLYNKGNGSAAIGRIGAAGYFEQTRSYLPGLHWTHVVATDNNLFFYNSTDGSAATAFIHPSGGSMVYTQSLLPGSLPTGFSDIISDGNYLLLFSQQTGSSLIGVIDGRPGQFRPGASVSLGAGYNKFVRHDHYLLLYDANTGRSTIGYIDRTSPPQFIVTQEPAFSAGWTHIVSTNDDLLFYNSTDGSAAVGRIDRNGRFQQTPQVLWFSTDWSAIVPTTR